jgi:hypothetical protein
MRLPGRDELLGELFRADENRVSDLVATVTPDIRARLALYCYRRSHLHTTGLPLQEAVTKTIWCGREDT